MHWQPMTALCDATVVMFSEWVDAVVFMKFISITA